MISNNRKAQISKCVITDYISAVIAWIVFFFWRKSYEVDTIDILYNSVISDKIFWISLILMPVFWLIIYLLAGDYRKVFRKSRLKELGTTFAVTFIGSIIFFFLIILNDNVLNYTWYYKYFIILFICQFGFTIISRLIITSITLKRLRNKKIGFNTLIVGSNGNAISTFKELNRKDNISGNIFVGFVNVKEYQTYSLEKYINHLGTYKDIPELINKYNIEEVIIAIENTEAYIVESIITILDNTDAIIKIRPDVKDILFGRVKTSGIFNVSMIEINPDPMPIWQQMIKRSLDIIISILALVIGLPVFLITAIGVRRSSPGPIFYGQERIGKNGKPFMMYKFRSMYVNAEEEGPQLSSKNDSRITPFGKILRKYRLDELPQFYTVLKGQMSLVGPRPERSYYINLITQRVPYYRLLLKIKPGITSWGQVKYGYAENVDQMLERLPYDLLYLENMSLAIDFKILIYTIIIVFQGRGE